VPFREYLGGFRHGGAFYTNERLRARAGREKRKVRRTLQVYLDVPEQFYRRKVVPLRQVRRLDLIKPIGIASKPIVFEFYVADGSAIPSSDNPVHFRLACHSRTPSSTEYALHAAGARRSLVVK